MTAQRQDQNSSDSGEKLKKEQASISERKEQETAGGDDKKDVISKVIRSSEAADKEAEAKVVSTIEGVRLATGEIEVPPDIEDSGVKSPQKEADKVLAEGSTLQLPITEEEYQKGIHRKVAGAVVNKVVFGVSSLFALATWVGRMVKLAHKHTMRVVFRKSSFASSSGEAASAAKAEKTSEDRREIRDAN